MKNGGLLTQETLKYCHYSKFVQNHLQRFNTRRYGCFTYVISPPFLIYVVLREFKLYIIVLISLNNLYGKRILKFLNHSSTFLI